MSPRSSARFSVTKRKSKWRYIVERWILARLRHQQFFSLGVLNARIMRRYGKSRRHLFEALDRPPFKALPAERFIVAEWKQVRRNIDYHVAIDDHY